MSTFEIGRCYRCNRTYRSRVATFAPAWTCKACGAPICAVCWREGHVNCQEHEDQIPYARLADAAAKATPPPPPVPPGAVARTAARDLEGSFITRVERQVLGTTSLYHPVEDRFYDNTEATRQFSVLDTGAEEVKRILRDSPALPTHQTFREMPLNKAFVCEVGARDFFGGRVPKVCVIALAVSPLDELVRAGHAQRAVSVEEFQAVYRKLATRADVFYYIGGFATTGWAPDSRRLLANGPNWVVGLAEHGPYGWRFDAAEDPRWREGRGFFLLDSPEEKAAAVGRYVADHVFELLMDQLTEDRVAQGTGVDAGTVRRLFEGLCQADRFLRQEVADGRARLVRVY